MLLSGNITLRDHRAKVQWDPKSFCEETFRISKEVNEPSETK